MEADIVRGIVIRGKGQGKALGFATANMEYPESIVDIQEGVWCGYAQLGGVFEPWHPSAICVGLQPMSGVTNIEVHCIDQNLEDQYDKHVVIQFIHFIRPMKNFTSMEELTSAIQNDVSESRKFLASHPKTV